MKKSVKRWTLLLMAITLSLQPILPSVVFSAEVDNSIAIESETSTIEGDLQGKTDGDVNLEDSTMPDTGEILLPEDEEVNSEDSSLTPEEEEVVGETGSPSEDLENSEDDPSVDEEESPEEIPSIEGDEGEDTLIEDDQGEDSLEEEVSEDLIQLLKNEKKITPQFVGRLNSFSFEGTKFYYSGYSYLKGIEIPNRSDILQQLKLVNVSNQKVVKTLKLTPYQSSSMSTDPNHGNGEYNYDWAKVKGYWDFRNLTAGTYQFKMSTTAQGVTLEDWITFSPAFQLPKFEHVGKSFEFKTVRIDGVTTLQMTVKVIHMNRLTEIKGDAKGLYLNGYSYISGVNTVKSTDIVQKLKFIDTKKGSTVKVYSLPTYYSTGLSKDVNHGAGIYQYDWSKFRGVVNVDDLPVGEYYLKMYTKSGSLKYDDIMMVQSGLNSFTVEAGYKKLSFSRATAFGKDSLKVVVSDLPKPEPPKPETPKPETPNGKIVVLDAGHGGTDPGAIGASFKEKDLNLDITLAAAKYLREKGVTVHLTRETDKSMSLAERSSYINKISPDLSVSIHNDANIAGAKGAHTIYSIWDRNGGTGQTLARNVLESIVGNTAQIANGRGSWYRFHPDNNQLDYYHLIRETRKPTVIVECSFMNTTNIEVVNTLAKRQQMGASIAKGILKTLGLPQ